MLVCLYGVLCPIRQQKMEKQNPGKKGDSLYEDTTGMYHTPEGKGIFKEVVKLALDKKILGGGRGSKDLPFCAGLCRVGEY